MPQLYSTCCQAIRSLFPGNKLSLAPLWLKDKFLYLIAREIKNAKAGEQGHIIAKMNSLCDRDIIAALYEASAAGVKIELMSAESAA